MKWIAAELAWTWGAIGYRIRPYDMLADRRRWFWEKPTRCGWYA